MQSIYKARLDEKYLEGTERPTEDYDPELWAEITNPKKGYVRGVGYTTQPPISTAMLGSQSSTPRPLTAEQVKQCMIVMATSKEACMRLFSTFQGMSSAEYMVVIDALVQRRDEALERERQSAENE